MTQVETNRAISEYVDRLSDAGPGAVGFFYYSGHGVSRPRDKINYLIPIDVRNLQDDAIWWKAISLETILNEFERGAPDALHLLYLTRAGMNYACRRNLHLKGFEPVADTNGMFIAYDQP